MPVGHSQFLRMSASLKGVFEVTTTHNHALASTFADDFLPLPEVALGAGRALRDEAIANDATGDTTLPLAHLWRELVQGECKIVDTFFSGTRCYVVSERAAAGAPRLEGRAREVLELLLRGCAQKNIGLDLGLAPSTVTVSAQRGLQKIGVTSKPSRVHPLLMLAASAAFAEDESVVGDLGVVVRACRALRVISVPRPELAVFDQLPNAERAIVEYLVEGQSHAGIARLRGTSTRTIANQVASVFRRLKVACRAELVCRLFALSGAELGRVSP